MIVNAYLKVTQKQWEDIKEKYVEPNMYHIVSSSKRKCKRCDGCSAYNYSFWILIKNIGEIHF